MAPAPLTRSSRYLYCIPPHTHALMRFRVQSVTAAHVMIYERSGVAVDPEAVEEPAGAGPAVEDGPLRVVPMARVDVVRTWAGAPPEHPVYYSSVDSYRLLHEMALVRYGLKPAEEVWSAGEEGDLPGPAAELDRLRRAMMAAHPDQGGSAEAFERAREAYDRARRQRWDWG